MRPTAAAIPIVCATLLAGCGGGAVDVEQPGRSRYLDADLPAGGIGLYVEGTLARDAGDDERAVDLLTRAARADDSLILVNQALGELHRDRGELSLAETFLRRLILRDPNSATGHVLLGEVFEMGRRFGEALDAYLAGLRIEPDNAAANLGAGRSLVAVDRPGEAVEYLRRGVALDPADGGGWLNLGRALDATGDLAGAQDAYERAVELIERDDDRYRPLLVAIGLNRLRQGRGREAIDPLGRAADLQRDAETVRLLGDAHLSTAEALRSLGDRDAAASAYAQAADLYREAIGLDAGLLAARNALGTTLIRRWDLGGRLDPSLREAALSAWRGSLEVNGEQPAVRAAVERFATAGVLE